MNDIWITLINFLVKFLSWMVIAKIIMSYFLPPYHPARESLDRLLEPLLEPIRRILPETGMIDFSPLFLILLVQLIGQMLVQVIFAL